MSPLSVKPDNFAQCAKARDDSRSESRARRVREDKIINIQTTQQLRELVDVESDDEPALQRLLETFPVRLTAHLQGLLGSEPIARQFLPDPLEVTTLDGQQRCFAGLLPTGVAGVERAYPDRCIIMPTPTCPAYCRYCFRKFYDHGGSSAMSYSDIDNAVAYVANEPMIKEVLITGGEPVMVPKRLAYLLDRLRQRTEIGPLRIACRSLVLAPSLVDDDLIGMLQAHQDLRAGKPVEVACHANHPDEISASTIDALARLRAAGIGVYNQTVLLRGVNCDAATLLELFWRLRIHGVESYYLFFAGPVQGMDHQRPRLADALAIKRELRQRASGRCNPRLIVTTRIGKVELGVDGWIVDREADGRHVWIRTPYTLEGFRTISSTFALPDEAFVDEQSQIVVRYQDGPQRT